MRERRLAERLLGVSLPDSAGDIHADRLRVSSDLAGYDAWIRFRAPREDHDHLIQSLGLSPLSTSGPNAYLPSSWKLPPEAGEVSWWDVSSNTPPDAASATLHRDGWIIAKHENGYTWIILSDTGQI
jgi:hypothetical protein